VSGYWPRSCPSCMLEAGRYESHCAEVLCPRASCPALNCPLRRCPSSRGPVNCPPRRRPAICPALRLTAEVSAVASTGHFLVAAAARRDQVVEARQQLDRIRSATAYVGPYADPTPAQIQRRSDFLRWQEEFANWPLSDTALHYSQPPQ